MSQDQFPHAATRRGYVGFRSHTVHVCMCARASFGLLVCFDFSLTLRLWRSTPPTKTSRTQHIILFFFCFVLFEYLIFVSFSHQKSVIVEKFWVPMFQWHFQPFCILHPAFDNWTFRIENAIGVFIFIVVFFLRDKHWQQRISCTKIALSFCGKCKLRTNRRLHSTKSTGVYSVAFFSGDYDYYIYAVIAEAIVT